MKFDTLQIKCTHDLVGLERAWRSLETEGFCLPYQRYDWTLGLTQQFSLPDKNQHCFISIYSSEDPLDVLAILPFSISFQKGVRLLQWFGDKHSNHQGGLYSPDFLRSLTPNSFGRLWHQIKAELPHFDALWLTSQSASWEGYHSPFQWLGTPVPGANAYNQLVFPHHDWKALAPTLRSKKARKRMRNEENRLGREADISWKTLDCHEEVERYLPTLFRQRQQRMDELGIPPESGQLEYENLYRNMLLLSIEAGNEDTSMMILKADDEMIAGMIMFEWKNILYPLLISMTSSRYRQWSPGEFLLRLMFQKACEKKLSMVDIGPGDQDYKTSWCNEEVAQFETIQGVTFKGSIIAALIRLAIFSKRTIKNNPRLWALYTKARKVRSRSKTSGNTHAQRIQELG